MKIIVIFMGIIIIFLTSLIFMQKKDIKKLSEDLAYINKKKLRNRKLDNMTKNKEINNLIYEINTLITIHQKNMIEQNKKDDKDKEMIASLSHDLRTPLTSIKGYTDLLLKDESNEINREYLEIISSRSDSMSQLVSSFYELSKLEMKELDFQLDYVDLEEILVEVLASFYKDFKSKGVEPIINIDEGDFKTIGDSKGIERIFTNLLSNCLKYGKDYLQVNLEIKEDKIISEFINDAKDIGDEDIEKLFDKFFVMDTSRQGESTGLGLYITRELVENMGYTIEAENLKGKVIVRITWTGKLFDNKY